MGYYVPLGPRGFLIRLGVCVTTVFGSWIYRRRGRLRRGRALTPSGLDEMLQQLVAPREVADLGPERSHA